MACSNLVKRIRCPAKCGRDYLLFSALVFRSLLLACADADSCTDLGFTGTQLCSDCVRLAKYVQDAELTSDCQSSCVESSSASSSTKKYSKAFLEIGRHMLSDFPHIETFVRKKAKDYKGLTVIDRFGALPRLVLKAGKDRETIRIDKWKTEHIEEFLQDKLLH
ncbi:hypothetical protein WJX72_011602 [[Myrmecia] bisecta]|uniref:Selenoprotein F n=1 Tax=[Myrmecia] bisecta TaxID=41462 RepID=A0AAW1PK62_9CHLO